MDIQLPAPRYDGPVSLERSLSRRRSVREFSEGGLSLAEVSQLLWAAQGVTAGWGGRTAPSGGACYPLHVYTVGGMIEGLTCGVYRYEPKGHLLAIVKEGDQRRPLADAALGQGFIASAPLDVVFSAVFQRITVRYGERGKRYALMEAGHAAQNVLLQVVAMGLGAVPVGAFDDERVGRVLGFGPGEKAVYLLAIGRPR